MPTDSEILTKVADLAENPSSPAAFYTDEIATLRKYAAIARALEIGTWRLFPVDATYEMNKAWADAPDHWITAYHLMYAAAPQFQEE